MIPHLAGRTPIVPGFCEAKSVVGGAARGGVVSSFFTRLLLGGAVSAGSGTKIPQAVE